MRGVLLSSVAEACFQVAGQPAHLYPVSLFCLPGHAHLFRAAGQSAVCICVIGFPASVIIQCCCTFCFQDACHDAARLLFDPLLWLLCNSTVKCTEKWLEANVITQRNENQSFSIRNVCQMQNIKRISLTVSVLCLCLCRNLWWGSRKCLG